MESDEWIKTVLIGTVLSLLSVLILPVLAVNGYLLRVMAAASRDEPEPPVFEEWGALVVDGLKLLGVVIVYVFVPTAVGVVVTLVSGFALSASAEGVGVVTGVLTLLSVLSFVVAIYLLPAGLTIMAREGSFGAAFDLYALGRVVKSGEYLLAVLLAFAVSAVLGTIAGVLSIVLVGIPLAFYAQIVTYYLLGRGVGTALGGVGTASRTTRPAE